jgi:hypothetical protein
LIRTVAEMNHKINPVLIKRETLNTDTFWLSIPRKKGQRRTPLSLILEFAFYGVIFTQTLSINKSLFFAAPPIFAFGRAPTGLKPVITAVPLMTTA